MTTVGETFIYRPHSTYDCAADEKRCRASVGRGRASLTQCLNKPVGEFEAADGKMYGLCAIHSPRAQEQRKAKFNERYDKRNNFDKRRYAIERLGHLVYDMRHKIYDEHNPLFDTLLKACDEIEAVEKALEEKE